MSIKDNKDKPAVDISDVLPTVGPYICPICTVLMLPTRLDAETHEFRCPICGLIQNPITNPMKHKSVLEPAVTEEQITEADDRDIFETVEEDSGLGSEHFDTEDNPILEADKAQDEAWRRKGYKVSTL